VEHPADEELEAFILGKILEAEQLRRIQEHIQRCHACIDRAMNTDAYQRIVKASLASSEEEEA
jgi:anti-sigma factor RsiW